VNSSGANGAGGGGGGGYSSGGKGAGGTGGGGGGGGGGETYVANATLWGISSAPSAGDGQVTLTYTGPAASVPQVFGCSGSLQSYTVPAGVAWLAVAAVGADGGDSAASGGTARGGAGAAWSATVPVAPGQQLTVGVGCAGQAGGRGGFEDASDPGGAGGFGYAAGGGGGASGKEASSPAWESGGGGGGGASGLGVGAVGSASPLLVAAGGGGGGAQGDYSGGAGGAGDANGASGSGLNAGGGGAAATPGQPAGATGGSGTAETDQGGAGGGGGGINGGGGGINGGLGNGGGGGGASDTDPRDFAGAALTDGRHALGLSDGVVSITPIPAPTLTLTSSASPNSYYQQPTFTATLTPAPPVGSVTFSMNGYSLCANQPLTNGVATCTEDPTFYMNVGDHAIVATYVNSNVNVSSGVTATLTQRTLAQSNVSVASSANPAGSSQPVTLTATVNDYGSPLTTPTGKVTFYSDGRLLGAAMLTATSPAHAQAILFTTALRPGTHAITASYGGDDSSTSGASAVLSQVVVQGAFFNDTAPGISYSGAWTYAGPGRGLGDYQDDVHATAHAGDSFAYTFTGTGISYIAEKSADEGAVEIYVDGVDKSTVSCQVSARNVPRQTIYSIGGLPAGQHTLKVVNRTPNAWMLLDALTVQ